MDIEAANFVIFRDVATKHIICILEVGGSELSWNRNLCDIYYRSYVMTNKKMFI